MRFVESGETNTFLNHKNSRIPMIRWLIILLLGATTMLHAQFLPRKIADCEGHVNGLAVVGNRILVATENNILDVTASETVVNGAFNSIEVREDRIEAMGWTSSDRFLFFLFSYLLNGDFKSRIWISGLPSDPTDVNLCPGLSWPYLLCSFGVYPLSGVWRIDNYRLEERRIIVDPATTAKHLRGLAFDGEFFWVAVKGEKRLLKLTNESPTMNLAGEEVILNCDGILGLSISNGKLYLALEKGNHTEIWMWRQLKEAEEPKK